MHLPDNFVVAVNGEPIGLTDDPQGVNCFVLLNISNVFILFRLVCF